MNLLVAQPGDHLSRIAFCEKVHHEERLAEFLARGNRLGGAAGRLAPGEDERCVGVAYVRPRAGKVAAVEGMQGVLLGDDPVLVLAPSRAPAAVWNALLEFPHLECGQPT